MNRQAAGSILDKIIKAKELEITREKTSLPGPAVKKEAYRAPPARGFACCLRKQDSTALVAEIKKQSPSRGIIRTDFNVQEIAATYTRAGAAAISVLADRNFFAGSPEYVKTARQNTHLPVLYKEFIIDPYQIYRARACGADAVLLIVKILTVSRLKEFIELAGELGLEVLAETHSPGEIHRALEAGASTIGINNRNLETFATSIETTFSLRREISDPGITVVSESGIYSPGHMQELFKHNVHAALVGESLMRRADLYTAVQELLGYREAG